MASLTDKVVAQLSGDIRTGTFRAGEKLPTEVALIARFQVSRSVIREAVSRLQAQHLVETRHGVGTFVLTPVVLASNGIHFREPNISDPQDILDILAFRIDLEAGAAALAAQHRTDEDLQRILSALERFEAEIEQGRTDVLAHDVEFHLGIATASGNRYFQQVQSQLGRCISPRTRLGLADLVELNGATTFQHVLSEHRAIYNAIVRRDPEHARAAMRVHLSNSRERLVSTQSKARLADADTSVSNDVPIGRNVGRPQSLAPDDSAAR